MIHCRKALLILTILAWCISSNVCQAQVTFQDMFTNRMTITNASGTLTGDNSTATIETNEPPAGGEPGGHSLWISWVAPADGVATFDTHGSSFDTTLSAFFFNSTNDTGLNQLHEAARDDDDASAPPASLIQFGALAGQHYEIVVDGFEGATGSVALNWSFINATSPPPVILSTPNNLAAKQGDPVSLIVNMTTSAGMQLQWFYYTNELEVTTTNLLISSLQPTNVGIYTLRVSIGFVRFFTTPTEVQINSDGQTNTLARDKIFDSLASPLIGSDGGGLAPVKTRSQPNGATINGLTTGYTGTQIFNTTFATTDPNEPQHCGVAGGASYWLTYQPPANGTLTLDTIGSSYDTVMEAYTFNSPPAGYQDLISIACDNNGGGGTAARVQFSVVKSRQYAIVVDGVGGARGTAYLNYNLNTNQPAQSPAFSNPSQTLVVTNGANVFLAPAITGTPPIYFSWSRDSVPITNSYTPFMFLASVSPVQTGNYTASVTNDLGQAKAILSLHVVVPPVCVISQSVSNTVQMTLPTQSGMLYVVEQAQDIRGPWQPWTNSYIGDGQPLSIPMPMGNSGFYRVRVQ